MLARNVSLLEKLVFDKKSGFGCGQGHKEKEMEKLMRALGIPFLVNILGGGLCGLAAMLTTSALGAGFYSIGFFLAGSLAWAAVYVVIGLRLVGENQFAVIERFNQYHETRLEGWYHLCLPGIIDRIAPNVGHSDFIEHEVKLSESDPTNEIDFTDGVTAPIKAQYWYRIIKKDATNPIESKNSVWRWTYCVEKTEAKASEIILGSMRGLLQSEESDKAQADLKKFGPEVVKDVKKALKALGIEIVPEKGVILTDIVLPPEIQEVKRAVLISKKKAEAMENLSRGLSSSISEIITQAKTKGQDLSWEEAVALSLKYRTLEVLEKKEGNINFVSPDLGGVVQTMDINRAPRP